MADLPDAEPAFPEDPSEPQWLTPLLQASLQFLALKPQVRQQQLPFRFEGRVQLDNGHLITVQDPWELMLLFLQEHLCIPEFWQLDPEFTFMLLEGHQEQFEEVIGQLQEGLNGVSWSNLPRDERLGSLARQALQLLDWPTALQTPVVDVLDGYTYGGFSRVARSDPSG